MDFSNEKVIGQVIDISNDDILPNRFQPRKYFDEAETLELADSIKEHGILQPVVVRQVGDKYEIIAGERRFKANILAGNDSIPAIVNDLDDKNSSEIAIIENIQRQNLTPIEEAISYKRIIDMGYLNQEQLARKIGKSQSAIANKIRLLKLSDNVQDALMEKKISERHARSLLKLDSLKKQDELLEKIIKERLTVRKTDEEIRKMNNEVVNNNIQNTNIQGNDVVSLDQQPMNNPLQGGVQINNQPESQVIPEGINNLVDNDIPMSNVSPIMGSPISTLSSENVDNQVDTTNNINVPTNELPTIDNPINNQPVNTENIINNNNVVEPVAVTPTNPLPQSNNSQQPEVTDTNIGNSIEPQVPTQNLDIFNTNPISSIEPINPNTNTNNNDSSFGLENNIDSTPIVETPVTPTIEQPIPEVNQVIPNSNIPVVEEPITNNFSAQQPIVEETTTDNLIEPISSISNMNPEPIQEQLVVQDPISQFNMNAESLINPVNNEFTEQSTEQPIQSMEQSNSSFMSEQSNNGVAEPVVDLASAVNQNPQPVNNDIPLANNIETPVQPTSDPIIVSTDDNQYDPIMPEKDNNEPTLDFKTIINLVRQCSQTIEKCGYKIDTEEIDMGDSYQVTFTIDKQ